MKIVLQKVKKANVKVNSKIIGSCSRGYCLLVGISNDFNIDKMNWMIRKILSLRCFEDNDSWGFTKNIEDIKGEILIISQFTLHARLISTSNITLQLNEFTRWVATQTIGDPNTIDNDAVNTGTQLIVNDTFTTGQVLINSTNNTWQSPTWLFNYTDLPTPILYGKADFQIYDDGTQIVNRTITRSGNDIFIKELYLVLGYWLEVEKNVTSLENDTYNVHIEVYNKGNQVTPVNATISLFDFIPGNFNLTTNMTDYTNLSVYSINTTWYTVNFDQENITGNYNGTLLRWAISGATNSTTGVVDPSFAQGPNKNENNTFIANFTIVGEGEYSLLDVFIVGVDPQQVDGATAATTLFVTEFVEKIRTSEGIFAALAGAMLVLGLLV